MEQKIEKKDEKSKEDIRNLQRRIFSNSEDIHITRVPIPTKKAFINLAKKEFAGDYGMLLKWLMDDILSSDMREVIATLQELNQRIVVLEEKLASAPSQEEQQPTKCRKMLNGKELKVNNK